MIREMNLAIAEEQIALDMNSCRLPSSCSTRLDAGSVVMYIEETTDAEGNVTESNMATIPSS